MVVPSPVSTSDAVRSISPATPKATVSAPGLALAWATASLIQPGQGCARTPSRTKAPNPGPSPAIHQRSPPDLIPATLNHRKPDMQGRMLRFGDDARPPLTPEILHITYFVDRPRVSPTESAD